MSEEFGWISKQMQQWQASLSQREPVPLDAGDRAIVRSALQPILSDVGSETDPVIVVECLLHAVQHAGDWSAAPAAAGRTATLLAEIEQLCTAGAIEALALELERRGDSLFKAGIHWTCRRFRLVAACRVLYRAFRRYPIERFLEVAESETTRKTPPILSQLSPRLAIGYFWIDFDPLCRAVIPRALELIGLGLHEREYTGGLEAYLTRHKWWKWPTDERCALEEYVEAHWLLFLSRRPENIWADPDSRWDFVNGIFGICPPELANRLVALWRSDPSLPATLHLAYYMLSSMRDSSCKSIPGEPRGAAANESMIAWCTGEDAQKRLVEAFVRHSSASWSHLLADAADYSAWLASRR